MRMESHTQCEICDEEFDGIDDICGDCIAAMDAIEADLDARDPNYSTFERYVDQRALAS
jgi:hypothetical protein